MQDGHALASLSDEALMERVGRQDRTAYAALVERHLEHMIAVAFRMAGGRAEAEDIVQEAFLRLWRSAPAWQARNARFSTWFHRVVINLCIDLSRKRKWLPLEAAGDIDDPAPSPEEKAEDHDMQSQIADALASLPHQQRAAVTLCYYEGLSNREAADVLQTSVKAVESLLVRARRGLAEKLASFRSEICETR
jgi:RNA polymerase sigma-70 factor (ECF subfamily)